MDHFLLGFTNECREIDVDDAGMVISWSQLEGTPGRKSHWEILGHPDTINRGDTLVGALFEGSQSWEVWVCGDDSLSEGMGLAEGSPSWLLDIAVDICHEDDGQGVREAERSCRKATQGQVWSPRDSRCCWCWEYTVCSWVHFPGAVSRDDMNTAGSATLEEEPGPSAQT